MGKSAEREEQSHTVQDCPEVELLYRHLLSSIEQNTAHYNFLMQRILTSAGFLSLAFTVLVVQYPGLLRDALTSYKPAMFALALSILASVAVFLYHFVAAVRPQAARPIYAPKFLKEDFGKEPCEVYSQLASDMNQALDFGRERNGAIATHLDYIVKSALLGLLLLGFLIVYAS